MQTNAAFLQEDFFLFLLYFPFVVFPNQKKTGDSSVVCRWRRPKGPPHLPHPVTATSPFPVWNKFEPQSPPPLPTTSTAVIVASILCSLKRKPLSSIYCRLCSISKGSRRLVVLLLLLLGLLLSPILSYAVRAKKTHEKH